SIRDGGIDVAAQDPATRAATGDLLDAEPGVLRELARQRAREDRAVGRPHRPRTRRGRHLELLGQRGGGLWIGGHVAALGDGHVGSWGDPERREQGIEVVDLFARVTEYGDRVAHLDLGPW